MGSRLTGEGPAKVYAAAEKWVDAALRKDDSLFTPGKPVWTLDVLEELSERYLKPVGVARPNFMDRLRTELKGISPEACQCMAEAIFVHFLIADKNTISASRKLAVIDEVLGWAPSPVPIPEELANSLDGLGGVGQSFLQHRLYHVGFILEFMYNWKSLNSAERESLLADPWEFRDRLWHRPLVSPLLSEPGTVDPKTQRLALMHITFPDIFEMIVATEHKRRIADAFSHLLTDPTDDIDRQLQQIRQVLEPQYGERNHLFYYGPLQNLWRDWRWGRFVRGAREFVDSGKLVEEETNYKMDVAGKLAEARRKLLDDAGDWAKGVVDALNAHGGNPMNWRGAANVKRWCTEQPDDAADALRRLWADGDALGTSVSQRIRAFSDLFPKNVQSGAGSRMRSISVLLMGLDAAQYPPFMITVFSGAYALTHYETPAANADEAELYDHALNFLDRFMEEAGNRGLAIQNRLDAQSLVWAVANGWVDENEIEDLDDWDDEEDDPPPNDLESLAGQLFLPVDFLQEITQLLSEKKQVIFQGPPGTGKTYLAQALAEHLAGVDGTVTRIQFHPSYAYEDFVEGFRPNIDGQGFDLRKGPLVRAAKQAESVQNADHYLLIDESNRGNLGKLFGELYFLLEYRGHTMQLQYSDEPFSLPKNLYIIGTMNTADRSIALVDLALRRRFAFVDFHPDKWPINGLLRDWLTANAATMPADMMWVADVVDRANAKLNDRDAAIGPSYFMRMPDLTEADVRRIWKSEVLPYISERLHESNNVSEEFGLDKLLAEGPANGTAGANGQPPAQENGQPEANSGQSGDA